MSFEPEAVRSFEHAGWQRAAANYGNTFAQATARFIEALLKAAEISPGQHVLDAACGPGDLAAAASARGATAHGLDFSAEMVGIARSNHPEVVVAEGDAEDLPYSDSVFDAVVSSFGIHHVPRPELALARCWRVLKPGGRAVSLEITSPRTPIWRDLFAIYFDHAMPRIGGWLSGRPDAYRYLPQSVHDFLPPEQVVDVMRSAGLHDVYFRRWALGSMAVYVGTK